MTLLNSKPLPKRLKSGDIIQYGIKTTVFNKKNLPNFRIVKHYGTLTDGSAWNGKVHVQPMTKDSHPTNAHRVYVENIYRKVKSEENLMDIIAPEGFTLKQGGIAVNEKGKIYAGQGLLLDDADKKTSTKKTIITLVDLSKSTRRTKKAELDKAIKKQEDFVKGKTNG